MIIRNKLVLSLGLVAALAALLVLALYALLRASLPALDGSVRAGDLGAPVSIARDRLGVVTVTASSRADLAYATGFVHAQDRFFQMDLSRRLAAGELSELVGAAALEQDRSARKFRFRTVARAVLSQTDPAQRAIVEAYARGVNAGIASLRSRPWEYWLLGAAPAPWLPEDTILVTQSMWWDLQSEAFPREILRQQINQRLGGAVCSDGWKCALSFFYPARTTWDAPDDGAIEAAVSSAPEVNDVPAADVIDLRHAPTARAAPRVPDWRAIGSNNWAIAGRLTATGAALVANDMHLTQRVPATWYHMRLRLAGSSTDAELDLNGVTLPGTPVLVAGSNGHIAWGFTNSYGTWFSVTRLACSAIGEHALVTASGPVAIERTPESIRVHNAAPVALEVVSAAAGVLLRADPAHQACWFGAWLAQQPGAINLRLMQLERAASAGDALTLAPEIGIPHQNLVVGDAQGHIGWSIAGRIPRNTGAARALGPIDWTERSDHPRLLDPPLGRIWTANGRVSADPRQEVLIGGNLSSLGAEYDLSARAQQIRDDLLALAHPATPADMLRIQLDDHALLLNRWRNLLLRLIDSQALEQRPLRASFRRVVGTWNGYAAVDSSAYRLVRAFRSVTRQAVWNSMMTALGIEPDPETPIPPQFEHALWLLVSTQPQHLLDPRYRSWRDFLLAQVDSTTAELGKVCSDLEHCTWGRRNTVAIRHPLSGAVPLLWRLVDMPRVQLPGDDNMPRVQDGTEGASERFAVSPGHESEGYFHMPGGQSGHPLSPYYRAGFMEWARGQPLPFLPGTTEHTLTLEPDQAAPRRRQ